jgi:hypothetical protein
MAKHALLLAEASSPAAVLPAVARLTMALLRIGVPGGVNSSSSIASSSSPQHSRHGGGGSSSSNSISSRMSRQVVEAMRLGPTRPAVYDVAASVASVATRIAASGGRSHADMFCTEMMHGLLLLELALNVQAVHQKQHGKTQLPEVSATVSAALQRSGYHPEQQQQHYCSSSSSSSSSRVGVSALEPWHEQLLLAVGVPPGELKLAADVTVKHADRYSTTSAACALRALTSVVGAEVESVGAATTEAEAAAAAVAAGGAELGSGSSDHAEQHTTVAAVGGCDRLLAPAVVSALLELLLLTCTSPCVSGRARQQAASAASVQAQFAAVKTQVARRLAAGLADAVLAHIKIRMAFARMAEHAAFGTNMLAQLTSGAISDEDAAGEAIIEAVQQRHQAAAARMPLIVLLGPMLQIGPAPLHLQRQCSEETTAGRDNTAANLANGTLSNYGGVMSELATFQSKTLGTLAEFRQQ